MKYNTKNHLHWEFVTASGAVLKQIWTLPFATVINSIWIKI